MPIIYQPSKTHECALPPAEPAPFDIKGLAPLDLGTLWLCDDCRVVWKLCHDDMTGHRLWVKLPKWAARRALKKLNLDVKDYTK